uniref:PAXX non-homologous end joining factor n=1 Tax=Canis lupus familiaris TaxID=9615 RepID=A0A8C0MCU6_CANLF
MVPPPLSSALCTLPPGPGGFNVYVTDAAELWSTCFTADSLAALKARFGLSAAEDITPRFRAACEQQAVTFTLQEDKASLTLPGGPSAVDLNLSRVPGPEAASRLQALTLSLAEQVCILKRQLAAVEVTAASPRKSPCQVGPQLFLPGKACHLQVWLGLCSSLCTSMTPEQDSNSRIGILTLECTRLRNSLPSCFPQTRILRELALDLGSGGGVQASPSSTLASRGTPSLLLPPVPRVKTWMAVAGPITPQCHLLFSPSKKPAAGVDFESP